MKRIKQWFQWFWRPLLLITFFIFIGAFAGLVACAQERLRWLNICLCVFDGIMAGVWIAALKDLVVSRRKFPNCSPDSAYKFENYRRFFPCPKCGEAAVKDIRGSLTCLTCESKTLVPSPESVRLSS